MSAPAPPLGLLAELTHRCPLSCAYCSNPLQLSRRSAELDAATWKRVFGEAASLGVLQLHLSGGEPTARADILDLTRAARAAGLYTNLITSGIGLTQARLAGLAEAGLDHLQLSIQDSDAAMADHVAGLRGAWAAKRAVALAARALGLPLTINAVIHRGNIDRIPEMIADAVALGAGRIEIAHTQYHGWALLNRAALLPTRDQAVRSRAEVEHCRAAYGGAIAIDYVAPDYFGRYPKPCMGGWGRRTLNVTPDGTATPCHSAGTIPGLQFWNVRERSLGEIWSASPAFEAFRGASWMKEPCASCPRREIDFGGCRCQALALTGDPRNTDPVCEKSPLHAAISDAWAEAAVNGAPFVNRRFDGLAPRPATLSGR